MTYVIQMPHSSTNPTDKYTLVLYSDWLAYVNEETGKIPVAAEYDTYAEANEAKTKLNAKDA